MKRKQSWKAHERSKKAEKVGGLQATLCHKQCHAEEHRWKRPSRHTKRETSNKGTMKRLPPATVPTYLVDRERQSWNTGSKTKLYFQCKVEPLKTLTVCITYSYFHRSSKQYIKWKKNSLFVVYWTCPRDKQWWIRFRQWQQIQKIKQTKRIWLLFPLVECVRKKTSTSISCRRCWVGRWWFC